MRICEFLRLVDYLIQELLHRVVKTSVKRLHEYVGKSTGLSAENKKGFFSETDRYFFTYFKEEEKKYTITIKYIFLFETQTKK